MSLPLARTIILMDTGAVPYSEEAATYDGTPSTTPPQAPKVKTPASISSDGTPQVGEALTGTDPVFENASITRRRWLHGSTTVATTKIYTSDTVGELTWSVDGLGDDGSTIRSEATIAVLAATATPDATNTFITSTRPVSDIAGLSASLAALDEADARQDTVLNSLEIA